MSRNLQEWQQEWPAASAVYEKAFVRAVLRLYGIAGSASPLQMAKARKVLRLYGIRVAMAAFRHADELNTQDGRLSQSAGTEHAFMFVRFDSVLRPDATQVRELNEWLASEDARLSAE